MKIVITGGGGYVGSELVSELADNGHEIICIDRFSSEEPQFGEKYENKIKILKINIDENPQTPQKFGVRGIPTLMFFKEGKLVESKVGSLPKIALDAWIQANL